MATISRLSVVIYIPGLSSMAHWAIYLRIGADGTDFQHMIYQAVGEAGELEFNVLEADPKASARFKSEVEVSYIYGKHSIKEVQKVLEAQAMQNEMANWNCQDWVMEALETLHEDDLVDQYDYD